MLPPANSYFNRPAPHPSPPRWQSCGAATSTCSPSHASRQRSIGILGGETAKQNLPFPALARSGAYPPPSCATEQELACSRRLWRGRIGLR